MMNSDLRFRYVVQGIVVGHGERVYGMWPFRKRVPTIRVRITQAKGSNHFYIRDISILSPLEVGLPEGKPFPVSMAVGITFGYATKTQQFFYRDEALVIIDVHALVCDNSSKHTLAIA